MGLFDKLFKKNKDIPAKDAENITGDQQPNISISVSMEVNNDIPAFQGDYAKTIFLNAYQRAAAVKDDDSYQRYLIYECGIKKPSTFHRQMIKEGYLQETSTEENLKTLKVTELKEILESIGEKKTGKKDGLVRRILDTADEEQLFNYFSGEKKYGISQRGKDYLEEHGDYILIHKHGNWGIDWHDYDRRKERTQYRFYDIVWGIFNERILQSQDFGRNEYLNMYQLLAEEGKRKRALEMLLNVLYIDLSGVEGSSCYELYQSGVYTKKKLLEYFNVAIMIAPGIVYPIESLADVYDEEMVDRLYGNFKLPIQICTKGIFKEIIYAVIHGEFEEEKYEAILKKEYQKFVNGLKI
ncbi:SAP domain-containing protein [Blautia producta]|uniref:SAP domain-containing protein n=1 Tax=Blautia producta TaxID=33035 RepID=UPI0031B64D35